MDILFSAGGSADPLVSVGVKAGSVSLNWPGELPVPTLSGAVATYADVLPGVDLRLRAEATGYTKHFVVRDAEAAKNLAKIRLGLATKGVTMKATSTGATEVRDSAGDLVLVGQPSVMWDDATGPGVDAPGDGARRAKVGVVIDKDSVTLVPDQALLHDPKTRWPVVIDPGEHTPGRHDWAKVMEGNPNDEYWHGGEFGREAPMCRRSTAIQQAGRRQQKGTDAMAGDDRSTLMSGPDRVDHGRGRLVPETVAGQQQHQICLGQPVKAVLHPQIQPEVGAD